MSHESSPFFEDDIIIAKHDILKPLSRNMPSEDVFSLRDSASNNTAVQGEQPCAFERPKLVSSSSRKHALLRSLIHLPAIVMTLGILSLSFKGVFWQAPTSSTNTILNILQFVAKIHEILIIASLTAIVFHRIRHEILTGDGLPFGLLSSSLQYSSLMALARRNFLRSLWSSRQARKYIGFMGIVVISFLLAATCGPSAAIAILPRLEWWLVPPSPTNTLPVIYLNRTGPQFPSTITYPDDGCSGEDNTELCFALKMCTSAKAAGEAYCPQYGLDAILSSGLVQSLSNGAGTISPTQIVLSTSSMFTSTGIFSRALNGNLYRGSTGRASSSAFVASVTLDTVALAFGTFWESQQHTGSFTRPMAKTSSSPSVVTGLQKPLVQVQCVGSSHVFENSTSDKVSFPSSYRYSPATSEDAWTISLSSILGKSNINDSIQMSDFQWVDLDISGDSRPSATAIFLIPYAAYQYSLSTEEPPTEYNNTFTCTIDALWMPSEAWIDPTIDDIIHEQNDNPLQQHLFQESHQNLKLDQGWLDMMNNWVTAVESYEEERTFQNVADICFSGNYTFMDACLEGAVALFIADGLSRMQSTTGQLWVWDGQAETHIGSSEKFISVRNNRTYNTPLEVAAMLQSELYKSENELVQFNLEIYQYGYAYGLTGSKGIYIAATILLIYVFFALGHMAVTIIGGWSSEAWSNPGELIALAMNSSPTRLLQNTCAGIDDPEIWTRIVSVRETSEAHLEIIFDETADGKEDEESDQNKDIEMQEERDTIVKAEQQVRRRAVAGREYGTLA